MGVVIAIMLLAAVEGAPDALGKARDLIIGVHLLQYSFGVSHYDVSWFPAKI